jgi:hypothetical protein
VPASDGKLQNSAAGVLVVKGESLAEIVRRKGEAPSSINGLKRPEVSLETL